MTIKAIFFDFDMTLVDTGLIGRKVYSAFSKHLGIKTNEKGFDSFMGTRISENIAKFAKTKKEAQELHNLFVKVHKQELSKIKVYGKSILGFLKKKKIKAIIISNTSRKVLNLVCRHFRLYSAMIIGDEDMPKDSEKNLAITKTLKKLKLRKEEVLYVGDHVNDIKEGKKAGIRVIGVTTGVYSKQQLARHKPYAIIKNLEELRDIL